jgi:hypothetical protein
MSAQLKIKKEMLGVHEQRLISLDERIALQTERGNTERVEFLNQRKANVILVIEGLKKDIEELEKIDVEQQNDIVEDMPEK